jgi:plastocyanin
MPARARAVLPQKRSRRNLFFWEREFTAAPLEFLRSLPIYIQEAVVAAKLSTFGSAILILSGAVNACLYSQSIEGTIVIKQKLTKRRVTAPVPIYERGPTVELNADSEVDPLAFERSRVVVYLEGRFPQPLPANQLPVNQAVAKMEQKNRRFFPEVLVIQAGSQVSFPNLDPVFHNIFSLSAAKTFDLGNYSKGDTRVVTFSEPGIVYVNCHLHSNMAATIVVAPNRWYSMADRDGKFTLRDVPSGKYTIVAWHKAAGYFRQQVQIAPGRTEHVEFLIPFDENHRQLETSKIAAGN